MLLPQLREVFAEGHKTLVFSQFTSMLAIVGSGWTRRNPSMPTSTAARGTGRARVQWFQDDPDWCS